MSEDQQILYRLSAALAIGLLIAGAVNSLVKGAMAGVIGGRTLGLRVGLPLLGGACAGLAAAWLWID
jgi:uncharacterized membrane protein (DUF4010 family)